MSGYTGEDGPTVEQEEWLDARGVNGSRTTGPTYPERTPRLYRKGDADPTPDAPPLGYCTAEDGPGCTWPAGHVHPQHIAGTGQVIIEVWPVSL